MVLQWNVCERYALSVALLLCSAVRLYPCSDVMKIHEACMLTTLQSLPSSLTWIKKGLILMPNYFWTWQPCSGQRVVGHNGFIGFLKRCAVVSKPIIATHNEDIPGTRWPIEPLVYSCLRNVWNLEKHCVALRWSSPNCCLLDVSKGHKAKVVYI